MDQRARYLGQTNGFGIFGIVEKVIGKADGAIWVKLHLQSFAFTKAQSIGSNGLKSQ